MKLEDFNYSLPKNLIAIRPVVKKMSKLLVCKKKYNCRLQKNSK